MLTQAEANSIVPGVTAAPYSNGNALGNAEQGGCEYGFPTTDSNGATVNLTFDRHSPADIRYEIRAMGNKCGGMDLKKLKAAGVEFLTPHGIGLFACGDAGRDQGKNSVLLWFWSNHYGFELMAQEISGEPLSTTVRHVLSVAKHVASRFE
jgi:hypothetical protein